MPTESFLASFTKKVQYRPDSPALSWNGGTIAYRELSGLMESAIEGLGLRELPAAHPVCVVGNKSPRLVATLLACFATGQRVLLPPGDLGEATLRTLCERAGCRHLITVGARSEPQVRRIAAGRATPSAGPGPGLMLTTSGSTGLPKVVPLSAAGVDRFMVWAAGQFEIGPGAVVLNYAPLNFDLCLLDVWTSLATGACVTLVAEDGATHGRQLLGLVRGATVVQAVPMLFRLLAEAAGSARPDLRSVRHVAFTGDVMPPELVRRMRRLFDRATIYNLYGCTETNDSFIHRVDGADAEAPVPIGHPIQGVTAAVVDSTGTVLKGAATGELVVRTPFQSEGYLDPALDRDRFVSTPAGLDLDPVEPAGGRFYRTGDLVRRDTGGLVTLLGRTDFQVKVRGVRVNTQEVEAVINRHDAVLESAVLAIPDGLAGHRLHAVIRPRPGATLSGLQLRRHCAASLTRTAIPGRVEIVDTPLPRTSTGKIDRNRLRLSRSERQESCPA